MPEFQNIAAHSSLQRRLREVIRSVSGAAAHPLLPQSGAEAITALELLLIELVTELERLQEEVARCRKT